MRTYLDCYPCFLRQGLEAAQADPQAALDALYAAAPETKDNADAMAKLLDGVWEYTGSTFLDQTADKWDATQTVLADAGIIENTVAPDQFFTNDYQQ